MDGVNGMKFNEIDKDQWEELKPYLDTCLLPVTGLTGTETPFETTAALEKLRDAMDLIEIPFKGRVVTYPSYHFVGEPVEYGKLNKLCAGLKESVGFRYVVMISVSVLLDEQSLPAADLLLRIDADLLAADYGSIKTDVAARIGAMWQSAGRTE